MNRRFVESVGFSAARFRLEQAGELLIEDMVALEQSILANPDVGDLVRGTGGLRKVRMAQCAVGRGKRGGARVYYLDLPKRAEGPRQHGSHVEGGLPMRQRKQQSAFDKIRAGLQDAIDYHQGNRVLTARDVHFPEPAPMRSKDIVALRSQLKVSQAVFARLLNVSPRTVQAWESNLRTPSDAALKLLHVAKRHPEVLLEDAA